MNHRKGRWHSMHYRIRVKGLVSSSWQEWFDGLQITQEEEGTTLLSGPLQDQAALYGVLLKIRSLNLTLLSLETQAQSEP
jgi:hypothetical protein